MASLNWKEIELVVSEIPFRGSMIQDVVQNDFRSLTWSLFSPGTGVLYLYTEFGTENQRLHLIEKPAKKKTAKLQRFVQFARANILGAKIRDVIQSEGDRELKFTLNRGGETYYLYMRFYSGNGANVIMTREDGTIMDLLYRRPGRDEVSGSGYEAEGKGRTGGKEFAVRERIPGLTFNQQLEKEYNEIEQTEGLEELRARLVHKTERELSRFDATIAGLEKAIELNKDFEATKTIADILAANRHRIEPKSSNIVLEDWNGNLITIPLNPSLTPGANVDDWYERFSKSKGTWENAVKQLEETRRQRQERLDRFHALLETGTPEQLRRELDTASATAKPKANAPEAGISFTSRGFLIIVGRTAKENDSLLRHNVKGNDWWLHTRDCPGGYVFIKVPKNKSVPLEVLLDAGNLAVHYSKAKGNSKVNLYYTQVKYLRRAKDGPLGLVLPSQEKNLTIDYNPGRLAPLLLQHEHI